MNTTAIYHSNAPSESGLCLVSLSDRELSRFIASGRLSAKIDKVGVLPPRHFFFSVTLTDLIIASAPQIARTS